MTGADSTSASTAAGVSSHNCWTNTAVGGVPFAPAAEGCHDADRRHGRWSDRLSLAGRQLGVRSRSAGQLGRLQRLEREPACGPCRQPLKIDAFGLFTGQVGYAGNNALLYVKGGAAVTDNRHERLFAGTVIDRAERTRWGGTVGVGLEYGFAPNWSFGVEYDHLFMGTENYNFRGVGAFAGINIRNDDVKQDVDLVTARVNYRWGGPVIPRY